MSTHPLAAEKKNSRLKWELLTVFSIFMVSTLQALVINSIYVPNSLTNGGISGIALLFQYSLGIPNWIVTLLLNIPPTLLAMKFLNKRIAYYAVLATVLLSLMLGVTQNVYLPIENPIIAMLFGAVLLGASSAIVVRLGASMGGVDIIGIMLNKKFSFSIGSIKTVLNAIIICCLIFIKGFEEALTSIVALFVCNVAFNNILQGLNRTKTVFIISDHWDEIAPHVLNEMHRGITYIPAKGAYSGEDKTLVYCIVRTVELASLRRIVREHDPKALFSIIDTREVVGRGFSPMS